MIIKPDSVEPELIDMCQDCVLWNLCKWDFLKGKEQNIIVRECEDYKREK